MHRQITIVFLLVTAFTLSNCNSGACQRNNSFENYAKGVIKKYDSNKNGTLEGREIKEMRRPIDIEKVDNDDDLHISEAELINYISRISSDKRPDQRKDSHNDNKPPKVVNHQVQLDLIRLNDSDQITIEKWINEIANSEETVEQFLAAIGDVDAASVASLSCVVPTGFESRMSHNIGSNYLPQEVNLSFTVQKTIPNTIINVSVTAVSESTDKKQPRSTLRMRTIDEESAMKRAASKAELEKKILERIEEKMKRVRQNRARQFEPKPSPTPYSESNNSEEFRFDSMIVCNENGEALTFIQHQEKTWLLAVRVNSIRKTRENR